MKYLKNTEPSSRHNERKEIFINLYRDNYKLTNMCVCRT